MCMCVCRWREKEKVRSLSGCRGRNWGSLVGGCRGSSLLIWTHFSHQRTLLRVSLTLRPSSLGIFWHCRRLCWGCMSTLYLTWSPDLTITLSTITSDSGASYNYSSLYYLNTHYITPVLNVAEKNSLLCDA